MQLLPVPPLTETIAKYLESVRTLQTPQEHEKTEHMAQEFLDGVGPRCQELLTGHAREQDAQGKSWLTDWWLDTYLSGRAPLQLTSNVAFQLSWNSPLSGVARAADFTHRIAAVHLMYLRGEMPPSVNGRGEELTSSQWRFLSGGIRTPGADRDTYVDGPDSPEDRHIVVLSNCHGFLLPISDGSGHTHSPETIAGGLEQILADTPPARGTFTDLSGLGSQHGADILETLLSHEDTQHTYSSVRDALFVLDLARGAREEQCQLRDLAFEPSGLLAHKTMSFRVNLESPFIGVNLEHSISDGATLLDLVALAKQIEPTGPSPTRGTSPESLSGSLSRPLTWHATEEVADRIAEGRADFARRSRELSVRTLTTPAAEAPGVRLSHDAAMQWLLIHASLTTWGRIRSTYEAVDMREFQAGRTESFRPHTPQAVAFCQALIDGGPTLELFEAARQAHSSLIKDAKTGQGIERHLFALRRIAEEHGLETHFFADSGYQRFTEDFLSTTSLGTPEHITRLAFAPVTPGGIGVNYTRTEGGYEFCLSYDARRTPDIDEFSENLEQAAQSLRQFLLSAHRDREASDRPRTGWNAEP